MSVLQGTGLEVQVHSSEKVIISQSRPITQLLLHLNLCFPRKTKAEFKFSGLRSEVQVHSSEKVSHLPEQTDRAITVSFEFMFPKKDQNRV